MLLTNIQVPKLRKAFANNTSANIKLSNTQLHKIGQSRENLGKLLGPLLKPGLPIKGNVLKKLTKGVLKPLGLTAVVATDSAFHKKMFGSGAATLIISNEEINYIMKIVKAKKQKEGFLGMLLGTSGASLIWNLLRGKGIIRAGKGTNKAGQDL